MSTSVASVVSHFPSAENGFTTTTSGSVSSGATSVGLNSVAGYANGEIAVFVIDPSNASKQTFTGVIDTSGVQVTSVVWTAGTNTTHASGATVVDYATATHVSMITKGLLVEHNQSGTHSSITASGTLAVTGATTLTGALTIKSYDGWIATADTWTYASATTFTIAGVDRTAQFPVGTKIKLTQTTAKYFYVTASAFSTNTTITVTGGSDYTLANAAITSPNLSYDDTPQAFPQSFAYSPTLANLTTGSGTSLGAFSMVGKRVSFRWVWTFGSGSSVGSGPTFTLPVTPTGFVSGSKGLLTGTCYDSSTGNIYPAMPLWTSGSTMSVVATNAGFTYVVSDPITSSVPMTWASADVLRVDGSYDV